jgi:hypothetical protein
VSETAEKIAVKEHEVQSRRFRATLVDGNTAVSRLLQAARRLAYQNYKTTKEPKPNTPLSRRFCKL